MFYEVLEHMMFVEVTLITMTLLIVLCTLEQASLIWDKKGETDR